jgi:hypothetical protein
LAHSTKMWLIFSVVLVVLVVPRTMDMIDGERHEEYGVRCTYKIAVLCRSSE